jgi:hypothetical protein
MTCAPTEPAAMAAISSAVRGATVTATEAGATAPVPVFERPA